MQWRQLSSEELVLYLKEVCYAQFSEVKKSLYNAGEYKITPEGQKCLQKITNKKFPLSRKQCAGLTPANIDKAIMALHTFDGSLFVNEDGDAEKVHWNTHKTDNGTLLSQKVPLAKKKNKKSNGKKELGYISYFYLGSH